jgi:hypothetical protein
MNACPAAAGLRLPPGAGFALLLRGSSRLGWRKALEAALLRSAAGVGLDRPRASAGWATTPGHLRKLVDPPYGAYPVSSRYPLAVSGADRALPVAVTAPSQ